LTVIFARHCVHYSQLTVVGGSLLQLAVSNAFHSPLMSPILEDFRAVAENIEYSLPFIPFISCVTHKLEDKQVYHASLSASGRLASRGGCWRRGGD
jgi:acyl transferase domain-containing protein